MYSILQPLIEDPAVTNIKIKNYNDVWVKTKEGAILPVNSFPDKEAYLQFIDNLCKRHEIGNDFLVQTITEQTKDGYVLKISLMVGLLTNTGLPTLHIRKIEKINKGTHIGK